MVETPVFEQPAFRFDVSFALRAGPLNAAAAIEHFVVFDAGDITGLVCGKSFEQLKYCLGRSPVAKHITAAPIAGHQLKDMEIGKCFARRASNFSYDANSSLG